MVREQILSVLAINEYIQISARRRNTLAVSKPIPVFAPVTMTTLPDKSGILSDMNLGFGGKICMMRDIKRPIVRPVTNPKTQCDPTIPEIGDVWRGPKRNPEKPEPSAQLLLFLYISIKHSCSTT